MAQAAAPGTPSATRTVVVDAFPTHNVDKPQVREMLAEPRQYWLFRG